MRQKSLIVMIVMIIGVFVVFNGQLSAEEAVGRSIFPKIETPHPYPIAEEGKTLVWSTTIHKPRAAWIKIHFSKFRLNPDDYIFMIDMNGRLIEQIRGKDVANADLSKFNVKSDGNKTVSFWGPAIDGKKVVVELHRTSNTKKNWGFTIDEVGIGRVPFYKNDLKIDSKKEEKAEISSPSIFVAVDKRDHLEHKGKTTIQINENLLGRMIYKKKSSWFTSIGLLEGDNDNRLRPNERCIDSLDVAATLEVRFYLQLSNSITNPSQAVYYSYYAKGLICDNLTNYYDIVQLKNNPQMITITGKSELSNNNMDLLNTYASASGYCCCPPFNLTPDVTLHCCGTCPPGGNCYISPSCFFPTTPPIVLECSCYCPVIYIVSIIKKFLLFCA